VGVVVEQFVEIAHPVEHQDVGMFGLDAQVLLHHRRVLGEVRGHACRESGAAGVDADSGSACAGVRILTEGGTAYTGVCLILEEPFMSVQPNLHDQDFYAWTQAQAALLKAGCWLEVDWANLVEEVESMGASERRELYNRLRVLLMHLLKWQYQAGARSSGWKGTINEQRAQLELLLADSPSLRRQLDDAMTYTYPKAREMASDETGLPLAVFPVECLYQREQVLGRFWPEADDGNC